MKAYPVHEGIQDDAQPGKVADILQYAQQQIKGNQKWQEGELSIVTSGFKKQFPPGLVVGTIQSPYRKKTGAELEEIGVFWDLPVQIADLSKILTVLVLPSLE